MKRFITSLLFVTFFIVVIGLGVFLFFKFEGNPPQVIESKIPMKLGQKSEIFLKIYDKRSGLREVNIGIKQNKQIINIFSKQFPVNRLFGSTIKEEVIRIPFEPLKFGIKDGPAEIIVQIRDASWRNSLKGNLAIVKKNVFFDLKPPKIEILSHLHYLVPGGSNLLVYRVSEPAKKAIVYLDEINFKCYPIKQYPGIFVSLIALPIYKKSISRFLIEVEDQAGNITHFPVPYYLKKKKYHHDTIVISDKFLKQKMPEFLNRYTEISKDNLLKAFLWINSELRKRNNREISQLTRESKIEGFYLTKTMLRLPHSATRANFGDQRTYYYHGQKIGFAIHLGIDLASVRGAPVPAAERGKVIFADYLGIYGNTIIIDHGFGLFSLYAHLAGFMVSVGDEVKRGQIIGYTDTTGLAGGDHLHFAVLVNGIFVEPKEWFDPKWVKTRILEKLKNLDLKHE